MVLGEGLDIGNVLGLSILLAGALLGSPGIPLGLALEIKDARAGGFVVTNDSLLVEGVQLKELLIGG